MKFYCSNFFFRLRSVFIDMFNFKTNIQQPPVGQNLLIHEVSRSHTTTHHSRYDSSGRVISQSQRPLPDNTQHSQQTDIPAPGGIRAHNLSMRAAADLRLRSRGHRDRLTAHVAPYKPHHLFPSPSSSLSLHFSILFRLCGFVVLGAVSLQ
jgi:hypothetical protein